MRWRQNKAAVLPPHLPPHDTGGVTAVANGDHCLVVDQVWYLLGVMLVRRCEVDGSQPSADVAGRVQLESVVPALVVLAECSNGLGHSVPVSSNQLQTGSMVESMKRSSAPLSN